MLKINLETCTGCKRCEKVCPFGAIFVVEGKARVQENCTLCGACVPQCPYSSLSIERRAIPKEELEGFKGVHVFAELDFITHKAKNVVFELLAKGRELTNKLEQELVAIVIGDDLKEIASALISYGADRVITCEHELLREYTTEGYTNVLSGVISKYKPSIVLFGATPNGRELAPRLAARLRLGLTADCTKLDIDSDKQLVQTRPAFGGNVMASIVSPYTRPQMATVRPNTFEAMNPDVDREGVIEEFKVNIHPRSIRVKTISLDEVTRSEDLSIEEASILVSIGKGIASKENIPLALELARELGGVLSSSRSLVDLGWVSHVRQVGQSGTTVSPELYLALGISGAVQHIVGMSSSKTIIAINKDPEAPIFDVADFGIVGDIFEIVPRLITYIKEYKSKS